MLDGTTAATGRALTVGSSVSPSDGGAVLSRSIRSDLWEGLEGTEIAEKQWAGGGSTENRQVGIVRDVVGSGRLKS